MLNNADEKGTTINQDDEALEQEISDLEEKKEVKGGWPSLSTVAGKPTSF